MDKICKDFYIGENDPITIRISEDVKITVEMNKVGELEVYGKNFKTQSFVTVGADFDLTLQGDV